MGNRSWRILDALAAVVLLTATGSGLAACGPFLDATLAEQWRLEKREPTRRGNHFTCFLPEVKVEPRACCYWVRS